MVDDEEGVRVSFEFLLDDHYDTLDGGFGNDTYLFGRGSGQDTVNDGDWQVVDTDRVLVAADVTPAEVRVSRVDSNLVLTILGTGDQVGVTGHVPRRCSLRGAPALSVHAPAVRRPRRAGMRHGRGRRGAQSRVQRAQFSVHASEVPA